MSVEPEALRRYERLMRLCFPTAPHFSVAFLEWLYRDNACGGHAVGFDAVEGDTLAAHYSCVPAEVVLRGERCRALLSLNTATHPDFQRQGLFTRLASATYDRGAREGFALVYGVANAKSTPGLVNKLGFQLVAPLEARVGVGRIGVADWPGIAARAAFRRHWDAEGLAWRAANPSNRVGLRRLDSSVLAAWAPTGRFGIQAWSEVPTDASVEETTRPPIPRLFLGLLPGEPDALSTYVRVPRVLKPSPLNFIYRNLRDGADRLDAAEMLVGFLDFDAF